MNTIRGFNIEFSSPDQFNIVDLFLSIHLEDFLFYTDDASIFYCKPLSPLDNKVHIPQTFDFTYLRSLFNQKILVERLALFLYRKGSVPEEAHSYESYLASKCQMIILAYDCFYLEIYCKKQEWLVEIAQALNLTPGVSYTIKIDANDARNEMYV